MAEPSQARESPAVSWGDRLTIQQALRTALAAGLCYWLARWLRLEEGYWAPITAIVVMQSQVGATVLASRDRFAGTAIGALVGWATALIWHHHVGAFAAGVLVVMLICSALHLKNAGRLAGVAVSVIVLVPRSSPAWHIALLRFGEVSFGIVMALAVTVAWEQCERYTLRSRKV